MIERVSQPIMLYCHRPAIQRILVIFITFPTLTFLEDTPPNIYALLAVHTQIYSPKNLNSQWIDEENSLAMKLYS